MIYKCSIDKTYMVTLLLSQKIDIYAEYGTKNIKTAATYIQKIKHHSRKDLSCQLNILVWRAYGLKIRKGTKRNIFYTFYGNILQHFDIF